MNEEALRQWIDDRLAEGEDATVYEFIREVLDRAGSDRELAETAQARIRELEDERTGYESEINRLKSHNYDLLMKVPAEENSGDGEVIENANDDGEIMHIDNLFVDPDEKEE